MLLLSATHRLRLLLPFTGPGLFCISWFWHLGRLRIGGTLHKTHYVACQPVYEIEMIVTMLSCSLYTRQVPYGFRTH